MTKTFLVPPRFVFASWAWAWGRPDSTLRLLYDFHNDDDMLELCSVSDLALVTLTNDKGSVFAE